VSETKVSGTVIAILKQCLTPFLTPLLRRIVTSPEKKAQRFEAATACFKWLKAERPELYRFAAHRG
jgi:hypothetical protein